MTDQSHAPLPRAVTFFAGARDHYQLPLALSERDWLEAFVTEVYWPFEHPIFGSSARMLVPSRMRSLRHQAGLPSGRVQIEWGALAAFAAVRLGASPSLYRFADRRIGVEARRIAARSGAPLFSYSYYVHAAFSEGADRPRHRFIFQLHPHPNSAKRILVEELERYPWAAASLNREEEMRPATRRFEELCEEPSLANGWVAASSFTAQTLAENGVPRNAIHIVPYGVDPTDYPMPATPRTTSGPLEILFVGSMIQRKGLCDLLEAMRLVGSRQVRLTLAGRGFVDRALLAHYKDVDVTVLEGLSLHDLVAVMHRSSLFILPSLVEGFAHVIAEAMCTGLPVIATPHTCAPDFVQDGVDGWIVPIRNPTAIADRLVWAAENRAALAAMGIAAAARARLLTWEKFRAGIALAYRAMLTQ
jgi:glycosyltransferase involved in cell wall biosynthesis